MSGSQPKFFSSNQIYMKRILILFSAICTASSLYAQTTEGNPATQEPEINPAQGASGVDTANEGPKVETDKHNANPARHRPKLDLTLDPKTVLSPDQFAAVCYLIGNTDERSFVVGFKPQTVKAVDAVTGADPNDVTKTNQGLLDYAHDILNGKRYIPFNAELFLRLYNPDNQTYLTDHFSSQQGVDLTFKQSPLPPGAKQSTLSKARIVNWWFFGGIQIDQDSAKQLAGVLVENRFQLCIRLRLLPGTVKGTSRGTVDAVVESYTITDSLWHVLPENLASKIIFGGYRSTPADKEFSDKVKGKIMVSSGNITQTARPSSVFAIMFLPNGHLRSAQMMNNLSPADQLAVFKRKFMEGEWHIIAGELFLRDWWHNNVSIPPGKNRKLVPYEFGDNGMVRIDGEPYLPSQNLRIDGEQVIWVP